MIELQMPSAQSAAHFSSSSVCVGGTNHLLVLSLYNSKTQNLSKTTKILLGTTLFPGFAIIDRCSNLRGLLLPIKRFAKPPRASLLDNPAIWAGRICVFYALLKAGLAGSPANPFLSAPSSAADLKTGDSYLGFSKLVDKFLRNPDKEAADRRKLVSKWHPTTKGTLRRNYRIPSKSEGKRLLKAIASLLSEDDHFIDATTHKGCQIRRESAHGESVCCNNVRALFDELPTPHLIVEITAFPAGPLSEKDYAKAEKLERVLRSSPSI